MSKAIRTVVLTVSICMLWSSIVIGIAVGLARPAVANHGAWHPTLERMPPSGQGPLLPDPNANIWAPVPVVPQWVAPTPYPYAYPPAVIYPVPPALCVPFGRGGTVCR